MRRIAPLIALLVAVSSQAAVPINDLGTGLYLGEFQGGLYPGGLNSPPAAHAAEGLARARAIQPRDVAGRPSADGSNAMISIGMSNTSQEFCTGAYSRCSPRSFSGKAAVYEEVNHGTLKIINGALDSRTAEYWGSATGPDYDRIATQGLAPSGLSEEQVQVAWVKTANLRPTVSLPDPNADAHRLVGQMGDISRALKTRYPNLQQIFFSSRIYGGYSHVRRNPEPYAYEAGLAVKWLVEAQINQMNGGGIDPLAGDLDYRSGAVPWIGWGPYLWADGLNPRSDGLTWEESDFSFDGIHPSPQGREKVADMLLDFMLTSEFTQPWFLDRLPDDFSAGAIEDGPDDIEWPSDPDAMINPGQLESPQPVFVSGAGVAAVQLAAVPEPSTLLLALVLATLPSRCWGYRFRNSAR